MSTATKKAPKLNTPKEKNPNRSKPRVSSDDFVVAYLETQAAGKSWDALSARLNLGVTNCQVRVKKLIAKGIPLPEMERRSATRIDVDHLKQLVAKYTADAESKKSGKKSAA